MNIHEYQAKALLKEFGVPVLGGGVAYTAQEAEAAAKELGGPVWVVKAQWPRQGWRRQGRQVDRRCARRCFKDDRHDPGDTPDRP